MSTVYLNGRYLPKDGATISVEDRGFLLSDGIYEVTPAYRGRLFRVEQHMRRLQQGLDALRIRFDPARMPEMHTRLITENALDTEEVAIVYLQITRGVAPRTHHFPPEGTPPTVYAFATAFHRPEKARWEQGYEAITVPDERWARVDIKSIGLLPNVLAQQAAVEAGVADALLVRDDVALEGSHNPPLPCGTGPGRSPRPGRRSSPGRTGRAPTRRFRGSRHGSSGREETPSGR